MSATGPQNCEAWHGCYEGGWKGLIVPAAYAHPAKMSRALVKRIFDELALPRGALVCDPFGGIGSTGIEAASRGLRAVLVELEPKFVALAEQNFALNAPWWERMGYPMPMIIQGDSRELRRHVASVDAVISSPPYTPEALGHAGAGNEIDAKKRLHSRLASNQYGESDGQLSAMRTGSVDAVVSSPPFIDPVAAHRGSNDQRIENGGLPRMGAPNLNQYGDEPGQLGASTGDTFWHAAAVIVAECHAILKPNGIAVWVTKDFIRAKRRVPFTDDWIRLCEAAGFVLERRVQATLVKEQRGGHMFEGEYVKTTERKSFFRRLAEAKGSPRIDEEDVTFFRRLP